MYCNYNYTDVLWVRLFKEEYRIGKQSVVWMRR